MTRVKPSECPARLRGRGWLGLLPAAAVCLTTLSGGGFDAAPQARFVVLSAGALAVAALVEGPGLRREAAVPLAVALLALAGLSGVSSAWAVGSSSDAIRSGLVVAGYAAIFITGAGFARRFGAIPFAGLLALLAVLEAVLGLAGVAQHALPDAERLGRVWRPGGSFEYPPALSLLEASALPVFGLAGLNRRSPLVAVPAGVGVVLAGAVLGLSGSRLSVALAGVLLVLMIARTWQTRRRPAAIATAGLASVGGLAAVVLLGGAVGPRAPGVGAGALVELVAVGAFAAGMWRLMRTAIDRSRRAQILVAGVLVIALAAGAAGLGLHAGGGALRPRKAPTRGFSQHPAPRSSFLHGRGHQWLAAIQTWRDRPIFGAGAGSFYVASLRHQKIDPSRYPHNLLLELAAELGVMGFLLGLWLYTAGAHIVYRSLRTFEAWLLGPLVSFFLISNLLDWTWHLVGFTALWAAGAGTLVASNVSPNATRGAG